MWVFRWKIPPHWSSYCHAEWLVTLDLVRLRNGPWRKSKQNKTRGNMPRRRHECHNTKLQTTTSSVEDFLRTRRWRGIQEEEKEKPHACGWSFKLEPESQLKGLGWITTGYVLMCCGHHIASLVRLPRGQQVRTEARKTNTPLPEGSCVLGVWSDSEKKCKLQIHHQPHSREHTIMSFHRIDRHWESALWREVKRGAGNALMPRKLRENQLAFCFQHEVLIHYEEESV